MELERLEKEDIEYIAQLFMWELADGEGFALDQIRTAGHVFKTVLLDCLFDNTERLEQARLEGEVDEWK